MQLNNTSLSKDDICAILERLKECTEVFERHRGKLSVMELALKSTLGALTRELDEMARIEERSGN